MVHFSSCHTQKADNDSLCQCTFWDSTLSSARNTGTECNARKRHASMEMQPQKVDCSQVLHCRWRWLWIHHLCQCPLPLGPQTRKDLAELRAKVMFSWCQSGWWDPIRSHSQNDVLHQWCHCVAANVMTTNRARFTPTLESNAGPGVVFIRDTWVDGQVRSCLLAVGHQSRHGIAKTQERSKPFQIFNRKRACPSRQVDVEVGNCGVFQSH